ncbi:MAG: hypothetical protein GEU28_10400 [Dehalococcoidia bacterium]|nr:hypothetical protein [Dehalococcoidia bacterium]
MAAAPEEASQQTQPTQLRLQLDLFEGPLEMLLSLIEQHRLPITQISLAAVADQYLAQVRALPNQDPALLADFLSIAGRLVLLKSRALLLSEEPDPVVEETAAELEERLVTYRIFRAAAERLQELELGGARTYPNLREPSYEAAEPPLAPIGVEALVAVWRRLAQRQVPEPATLDLAPRASVEERRGAILDAVRDGRRASFLELAGDTVDQVIATFLAILELFRRGLVSMEQPTAFGDVIIDLHRRRTFLNEKPVALSRTEWRLLEQLALHAGRILVHEELLSKVWGPEYRDDVQYLRVWISRLRQKLEPVPSEPKYIKTVPGIGYVLELGAPKPAPA